MPALILALALLASCGVPPLRVVGCPSTPLSAFAALVDAAPDGAVEVFCVERIGWPAPDGAAAVTDWPGSSVLYPARVRVLRSLDDDARAFALAHEARHLALWRANGDPCREHAGACGWSEP